MRGEGVKNYNDCPHCQGKSAYDIGDQLGKSLSMSLGEAGEILSNMVFNIEKTRATLSVGIVLETCFDDNNQYEVIDEETVEIHYCPFCGRKLIGGK